MLGDEKNVITLTVRCIYLPNGELRDKYKTTASSCLAWHKGRETWSPALAEGDTVSLLAALKRSI